MKRVLIGIIALLIILWAGATFVISGLTEKGFNNYADKKVEGSVGDVAEILQMDLSNYNKGFLSSTATSNITGPGEEDDDGIPLIHKVYHGPLAFTPDGLKVCFSYAVTTIDWSSVDEEVSDRVKKAFGDKEPITFTVLSDYSQNQTIDVIVPSAEYTDDEGEFRFDGAHIHMVVGKDAKTIEGNGEITALTSRINTEDTKLFFRAAPSKFDFDIAEGKGVKGNLDIGKINSTGTSGKDSTDEFGMEFSGIQGKSDFTSSPQSPNIMLGTAFAEIPSLSMTMGKGKKFSLSNIRFDQVAEEKNGKLNGKITYKIKGFDSDMAEMAMFKDMLKGGAELGLGIEGIPFEAVEVIVKASEERNKAQLRAIAQNNLATVTPEIDTKMVKTIVNGIEKGTRLFMALTVGENQNQSKVALDFSYDGAKKLLDVKTNGELIGAILGKVEARLPKGMVDSNPLYMMMLGPQIERGMIKQSADAYTFDANLTNSKLLLNDQEFPFAQMMGPMLDQEIPWDEFLKGVAEGMSDASE